MTLRLLAAALFLLAWAPPSRAAGADDARSPADAPSGVPGDEAADESANESAAADRVAQVRIAGNRRIESAALLPLLSQKENASLDRLKLREDVKTLWSQKFFSDVKVDLAEGPSGAVVTFLVTEKPLVREVKVLGNTEIDEEDLKKELDVKPFQIIDTEAVRRTTKKLQEKYADKGFYLAEVTSRTVPGAGENEVDVIFDVVEHAKVEVRRIAFQGNKALTDDELKANLGTQEASLISFLTSQGTYKEEVFQRDLLIIQSLYYNKGYINVRVGRPAISLSADKRFIFVTIPVEEGDPYDYGEVGVGGELLGDEAGIKALLTIAPGQRFSSQDLQKTMVAVQDYYRDRGYAYVQVTPQTAVDVATKTVDIRFVAQPGQKVTIERIEIVGNTKTQDRVIRRELRLAEGDTYTGSGVKNSKGRVTALGYFEAVDVTSRQGSRPDTMVLEVSVKEKPTGTFQVGLGFSNQEPILLNANVSQNNLFGWGYIGAITAQLSNLRRIFSISFTNPYVFDTDWTGAFDFYNTLQVFSTFDRNAFGFTLTGGYQLVEDLRFFATYTLQEVDVTPRAAGRDQVELASLFRDGVTNSIKLSFNYDRRDNRLFPTKGFLLSGSVELAPGIGLFENEYVFTRYTGIARFYRPIGAGFVFKVNATLGYVQSRTEVPVSERFFEGGINSLRGYSFRTIAPGQTHVTNPALPSTTVIVGGNKELLTNWEVEFPLLDEAGLRGVVFFDAGNVWGSDQSFLDQDAFGNFGLLMSVGLGARWFTPLGPLRFELGFPLVRRPQDDSSRFEFTIGNFF